MTDTSKYPGTVSAYHIPPARQEYIASSGTALPEHFMEIMERTPQALRFQLARELLSYTPIQIDDYWRKHIEQGDEES